MSRRVLHAAVALAGIVISLAAFAPAGWLAYALERQSQGRLTLADADGSVWRGSAWLAAMPAGAEAAGGAFTPLLPGRFEWQLSPALLLGRVDLRVINPQALPQPLQLRGGWRQWTLAPAALLVPAERLAALGAPLNTLAPSGRLRLVWDELTMRLADGAPQVQGAVTLELDDIGSRLSRIAPLGSYRMRMLWQGQAAALTLSTVRGPLLLQGGGTLKKGGGLQFSGRAEAAPDHEQQLANLLNLLGQRRQQNGKNFIAIEFK